MRAIFLRVLTLVFSLLLLSGCRGRAEAPTVTVPTRPGPAATGTPLLPATPASSTAMTAPTGTPAATPTPQRIEFVPGAVSATLTGEIAPGVRDAYLFWAQAEQQVSARILSPGGAANFAILGVADGLPYKRLVNEDRAWEGVLASTQDYHLVVAATEMTTYELTLQIEPVPATLPPIRSTGVAAIYDSHTAQLLGGVDEEGGWMDVEAVASRMEGGERYTFYLGAAEAAAAEANAPLRVEGICTSYPVTMTPDTPHPLAVAISGAAWQVTPRELTVVDVDQNHRAAVAALLQGAGLETTATDVLLHDTLAVDLDGDGTEEIVTSAARLLEGGSMPPVAAGDYALVAVLTALDEGWKATPVVMDVYAEAQELAYPWRYKVPALLDLNGDGRLEVVVAGTRWEGRRTTVYTWLEGEVQAALSGGCAP